MPAKPGEHSIKISHVGCSLTPGSPEQLILPDDPSFLPEFVLPPADLLAELNLGFNFNMDAKHPGDSQSLTPFGSQRSSSSPAEAIGGLVFPSSSPGAPAEFRFEADDAPGTIGGPSGLSGAGGNFDLDEPDFTFGDDGGIIQLSDQDVVPRTPGMPGGFTMHSDAGASARVRREHEEGQRVGAQVSFAVVFHLLLLSDSLGWSPDVWLLPSLCNQTWCAMVLPTVRFPFTLTSLSR